MVSAKVRINSESTKKNDNFPLGMQFFRPKVAVLAFSYYLCGGKERVMESYLNTTNIARSADGVEWHPLTPFLPESARVLFLGSFPPQRKRWCMDFYYPNFINDHWRIEGAVFFR